MPETQNQALWRWPKRKGGRTKIALSRAAVRSAISNGTYTLPEVDHRSAWMRRLRDLAADITADLGGDDVITAAERILVRRASMLCLQLELQEQSWAKDGDGTASARQLLLYGMTSNTLRRVLQTLGLQRRMRDVTPTLDQYLRDRQEAAE